MFIGFKSVGRDPEGYAVFDKCELTSVVDEEGLLNRRRASFTEKLRREFAVDEGVSVFFENGKILIGLEANHTTRCLPVLGERDLFAIEAAVRPEHYDFSRDLVGYGYRFSIRDGGRSYRELRFMVSRKVLELVDVVDGVESVLYHRDHFFFTSSDFHNFRIEAEPSCVSVWIDGSQYAVVDCPMIQGGVEFVMTDTRVSLYNLRVE